MKKILSLSFILLLLCIVAVVPASASSQGGMHDGVYLIYDAADLVAFAEYVNGDITHVATDAKLLGNIDLSGVSWTPIGTDTNRYAGTFDGNGYCIKNHGVQLTYTTASLTSNVYGGVFGFASKCTIKNIEVDIAISVSSPVASGNVYRIGGLVGDVTSGITITNCYVHGSMSDVSTHVNVASSSGYISGFVGHMLGTKLDTDVTYITNCISDVSILSLRRQIPASSFVGSHDRAIVNCRDCYAGGHISIPTQNRGYGGFAFQYDYSKLFLENCANIADSVSGGLSRYGLSLVTGYQGGITISISNCYSNAAQTYSAGISGSNVATWSKTSITTGSNFVGVNGQSTAEADMHTLSFWRDTLGWNFDTVWYFDDVKGTPMLTEFVGIKINSLAQTSFDVVPEGNSTITAVVDAESELGGQLSYAWYYSVDSGATWTAAAQASATPTLSFTPQTAGTYTIKVVITDTERGFSVDSHSKGYTNLVTTVLPTYEPQSVITKTSSVESKTADNYQAKKEFDFSGDVTAAEWLSNDNAYVAAGNAVYNVIGNEYKIEPVAEWTGNNISAAYLGNTRAIINDIDNNVAVYTYETGEAQYVTTRGSNLIAVTNNYAGVISSGTLNIYNLQTGKLQASITTSSTSSAETLQANDKTDVFVTGYGTSGNRIYLHYYVINGNTITEKTADPLSSYTRFRIIKQVRGTSNWIVNYDTYIYKMYMLNITNTQASTVFASAEERAYTIAQATESNAIIAANGDRAYLIATDGKDIGSYETGGKVNDVSIAKSNGLYAVFGGDDNQVYFLNKRDTSSWIVGQTTDFLENVKYSQVSTKGTFVLVGTETNKMFLLEWDENVESNFFINGVVINGNGQPYANKYITIDAHSVQTDDNGFFVYPVKPGTTYTISAGSTTIRYTATNQALQPLAITLKSHLIEQDVTYSATYNKTSGNIVMRYNDAAALTSSVKWTVRDTKTNTVVHEQTVSAGQESFYFVPTDKQNDNYYVQVTADREDSASVKNTWSITPSGTGHEVNLFGMDETGRNILFGFFLIVLTGLFGYMHQHVGCIIVAFAALLLRFLGLITIPWIVIIIASVLAVVAAIARRGEGK